MKKTILILFLLSSYQFVFAQFQKPSTHSYSLKFTYGKGTHLILGASLHHINKKGFSISGQAFYESRLAQNVPDDIKPQGFIFSGLPKISITTGAILIGKSYGDVSKLIRFDLRGGINLGNIERPINFEKKTSTSILSAGEYYDYTIERKWFAGLIVNPTIDFTLTSLVGLSFGVRANINHQDITTGFEIGLLFGDLRGRLSN